MIHTIRFITFFLIGFCYCIKLFASEPIKVACIGNSITYGAFIQNRELNCYPAQLAAYLGDQYEVRNFGVSATTLLKQGDFPYTSTDVYKQSLSYQPDIVFIKLGTNDSKPQNRIYLDQFKQDYLQLIDSYRNLPSKPRIILLTPLRCFIEGAEAICDSVIQTNITPVIKDIAYKQNLDIINLYTLLGDQWKEYLMPDKLHPSSIGAGRIASKLYAFLAAPRAKEAGYAENMCIHPIPGNEYRSGAGWTEGADWHTVAQDIQTTLTGKKLKLLMLGNSITQGFGGNRATVAYKPGKEAMDKIMGVDTWESAGISGDCTQHLLWRLKNGDYNRSHPQVAIITIGINNVVLGDNPADVVAGIKACAFEARRQMPDTRIILFGLLPAGKKENSTNRIACDKIHELLSKSSFEGIEYINPTAWFVNPEGSLKTELYGSDFLHLNSKGYEVWCSQITRLMNN